MFDSKMSLYFWLAVFAFPILRIIQTVRCDKDILGDRDRRESHHWKPMETPSWTICDCFRWETSVSTVPFYGWRRQCQRGKNSLIRSLEDRLFDRLSPESSDSIAAPIYCSRKNGQYSSSYAKLMKHRCVMWVFFGGSIGTQRMKKHGRRHLRTPLFSQLPDVAPQRYQRFSKESNQKRVRGPAEIAIQMISSDHCSNWTHMFLCNVLNTSNKYTFKQISTMYTYVIIYIKVSVSICIYIHILYIYICIHILYIYINMVLFEVPKL